mmetsp:Transcript_29286/g.94064  ORF Transcript_29286/g.94064 Transcript_29286/m.94064 type:complete len:211 (-) Transcript_29286:119-751(-)
MVDPAVRDQLVDDALLLAVLGRSSSRCHLGRLLRLREASTRNLLLSVAEVRVLPLLPAQGSLLAEVGHLAVSNSSLGAGEMRHPLLGSGLSSLADGLEVRILPGIHVLGSLGHHLGMLGIQPGAGLEVQRDPSSGVEVGVLPLLPGLCSCTEQAVAAMNDLGRLLVHRFILLSGEGVRSWRMVGMPSDLGVGDRRRHASLSPDRVGGKDR